MLAGEGEGVSGSGVECHNVLTSHGLDASILGMLYSNDFGGKILL